MLSNAKLGLLTRCIFDYHITGTYETDDPIVDFAMTGLVTQFERDSSKWLVSKEKRKEAGRKGGLAKASNAKQCLDNQAVSVSVSGSVSGNGSVKETPVGAEAPPRCNIEFVLKSGAIYLVCDADYVRWKETFPCDVDLELRKASEWLRSNPSKRKTKTGMPRFISSWLGRADEEKPKGKNGERMIKMGNGEWIPISQVRI